LPASEFLQSAAGDLLLLAARRRCRPDRRNLSSQIFVGGVSRRRGLYPDRGLETAPTRRCRQRHHARHRTRTPTATGPAQSLTARHGNPLQHPPADQYKHNRCDPGPIIIEAGMPSSPASRGTTPHGQEDLEAKPDATHLTPARSDRHLEQLPPVKRIFGYFFCNRKK